MTSAAFRHFKRDRLFSTKANRWLWYGFDATRQQICGYVLGRRTDESCEQLLKQLADCQVLRYCTDAWESYEKLLPTTHHWVLQSVDAKHRGAEFEPSQPSQEVAA